MSSATGSAGEEKGSGSAAPSRVVEPARSGWHTSFRRESFSADWTFVRRMLIAVAIVGLAYFCWSISRVLLLVFAAILLAVLFDALAELLGRFTPIGRGWRLPLAILLVAGLLVAVLILFGAQLQGQIQQLVRQLPESTNAIGDRFGVPDLAGRVQQAIATNASGNVLSRVAGIGATLVGVLADLLLVVVAGIYLAASPDLYRRGATKLFPASQHQRIEDALDLAGTALRLWAGGQLVTMTLVGTLAGLAYWLIGLPAPLALGLIAAVTNFIPFLGPILGAIPALIFAFTIDVSTMVWTLVAVVAIQQAEGNIITPYIQKHAVSLPPALGLFAILVFGVLFGFLGIFLAIPLTVALMVLVKKLWIREALGEDTSLPGEHAAAAET